MLRLVVQTSRLSHLEIDLQKQPGKVTGEPTKAQPWGCSGCRPKSMGKDACRAEAQPEPGGFSILDGPALTNRLDL